jgi:hypothetical protein
MQTTEILNPLGLTVWTERPGDLAPYNEANRAGDLAAITASMEASGWQGLPLVIDDRGLDEGGQLLTGSHRHAAALALGIDVPLVSVTEVAERAGLDLDAFDYGDGTDWEQFFAALPAEVLAATGFDL